MRNMYNQQHDKMKYRRVKALFLMCLFISHLCFPICLYATTGGPQQPEFSRFTPADYDNMVDLFSGDFNYNIPLLDVDGYPINLSYNSNVTMEEEAGWVGLGWTLNPGALNRTVRGLPDDFSGKHDRIKSETKLKPNRSIGVDFGPGFLEAVGVQVKLIKNIGIGLTHNNYTGVGFELKIPFSISKNIGFYSANLSGVSINSKKGLDLQTSLEGSLWFKGTKNYENINIGGIIGGNYNSRAGITSISIDPDLWYTNNKAQLSRYKDFNASTFEIGSKSYTPFFSHDFTSVSVNVDMSFGAEFTWLDGELQIGGNYATQFLKDKVKNAPAYGYMYSHESNQDKNALLDFNREKDGTIYKSTPGLPVSNFTYDLFSCSGQGVSGSYRIHRSDIGIIYDAKNTNTSHGVNVGVELAPGNLVKGGVNAGYNFTHAINGRWNDTLINGKFGFVAFNRQVDNYEPYYFKKIGELSAVDEDFYTVQAKDKPARIKLNVLGETLSQLELKQNGSLSNETMFGSLISGSRIKRSRTPRAQPLHILTVAQASALPSKDITIFENNQEVPFVRNGEDHMHPNHFSEAEVIREDGVRYYYGLPVYNLIKKEVSFNAQGLFPNPTTGDISYNEQDVSISDDAGNERGIDHYVSKTTTPAYVQTMPLTAVVSADYVDVDLNGVSDNDLGTYTKFTYKRTHSKTRPYRWRTPSDKENPIANRNEGFFSKSSDNKGLYTYGEKEVYYVNTIETKNFVAEFYTSGREDALGVLNETGAGYDEDNPLHKLDKIVLYSKVDRQENGNNATPIKTVHFEYDYSLMQGVPNSMNDAGKLTLRKVYFTYENSQRGELNPYAFHYDYNNENHPFYDASGTLHPYCNPNYHVNKKDRWGFYQDNDPVDFSKNIKDRALSHQEFPFKQQNKSLADYYAEAWLLNTISLPTGGVLKVDYESDSYKYVQEKNAMQMVKVLGVAKEVGENIHSKLFSKEQTSSTVSYTHLTLPTN